MRSVCGAASHFRHIQDGPRSISQKIDHGLPQFLDDDVHFPFGATRYAEPGALLARGIGLVPGRSRVACPP